MKLKFVESSEIYGYLDKVYKIDKYKDDESGKWYFVDKETNKQISFKGQLGEEVEYEK